jgi:hypothetical protein
MTLTENSMFTKAKEFPAPTRPSSALPRQQRRESNQGQCEALVAEERRNAALDSEPSEFRDRGKPSLGAAELRTRRKMSVVEAWDRTQP